MRPRVLYMGTARLACPPLAALHASTVADVVGVVTQPDRPGGTHRKGGIGGRGLGSAGKACAAEG